MVTSSYACWPFPVDVVTHVNGESAERDQVAFLEAAHGQGFEAFRFGVNDYGARSGQREGCILERGRTRWELRLAEGENRRMHAYVNHFGAAGRAVTEWLRGASTKQIIDALAQNLITLPGANSSYSMN